MKSSTTRIIFFIFLFSPLLAFSNTYYSYLTAHQEKELHSLKEIKTIVPVYTSKEREILSKLGTRTNVFKITTDQNQVQLKNIFKNIVFEKETTVTFNQYEESQWYLKNLGGQITRWITDIDTQEVFGTPDEDIALVSDDHLQTKKIKVAIIDSGIDLKHPDLKNNIQKNPRECKSLSEYKECLKDETDKDQCHENYANLDHNKNGYPLDCNGWSLTNKSYPGVKISGNPEINDNDGHGTHVAGIIGAERNQIGINGIAKNITLIPIQVAGSSTHDSPIESIAKGVLYAIEAKADIINLSLGWRFQYDSTMMREMIQTAISQGILVVVAAGNNSHSDISYPCAYQDVICVGAHDQTGGLANFSNRGTQVDLIAPGKEILSTWPLKKRSKRFTEDNNYELMSGTSQAAPITSGVLARLLSRGFSSSEAFIKVLKGTRKKLDQSDIRFGNLDYKKAVSMKAKSFIYPLNKEPALINLGSAQNKFKLKLKNYGEGSKDIQVKLIPISAGVKIKNNLIIINELSKDAIYVQDIHVDVDRNIDSELKFNLQVKTENVVNNYIYRVNLIRVIHPEITAPDISEFNIEAKLDSSYSLRVFDNVSDFNTTDFFALRVDKNSKSYIRVLKQNGNSYTSSKELPIRDNNPVFLNLSKIDIDIDSKADYVMTYVTIDKTGTKVTKFFILDHNLKPKRILLAPKNEFKNDKTFLPGKFKWIKVRNQFMPSWIGFGENGTEIITSPWESTPDTEKTYFYYMTPKGLRNFTFPKKEIVLNILYQTEKQKKSGHFHFITSKGQGFYKTYFLYLFNGSVKKLKTIESNSFFDIFQPRPLPYLQTSASAFFNEVTNGGGQNIFTISVESTENISSQFIKLTNPFERENIKFINHITDNYIFFQSEHKIAVLNRKSKNIQYKESKVDTKRRRLKILPNAKGIFLPAKEAPGYTSETLVVNNSGKLVAHGQYRTLAINGCEEFGIISKAQSDYIGYSCIDAKKILLMRVDPN